MLNNVQKNNIMNAKRGKYVVTFFGILIVLLTFCIVLFIAFKGSLTFIKDGNTIFDFIFSSEWAPDKDSPSYGVFVFISGSIMISILALLISTPLSLSLAIFMTIISPTIGKRIIQPAIEIFVGIPSVVYGWLGLSILVPLIKDYFGGVGFSVLAGGIVLSIMILPTITAISADSFKSLPRDYREASFALGATRWQTIRKVLLPAALPGVLTGLVLGLARAFGEALAVQMVIGNSPIFPKNMLNPTATMTSIITVDMGNTVDGTPWNNALWTMALILLGVSFLFIVLIRIIGKMGWNKE